MTSEKGPQGYPGSRETLSRSGRLRAAETFHSAPRNVAQSFDIRCFAAWCPMHPITFGGFARSNLAIDVPLLTKSIGD